MLAASMGMANKTVRLSPVYPKAAKQLLNLLEGDDTEIFKIDRSNQVLQIRTLRRAIIEGAEEMDMVADETVFVKSVSHALTRTAGKLYRLSEELDTLRRMIEQARPSAAPGRPARKPTPSNRRKKSRAGAGDAVCFSG